MLLCHNPPVLRSLLATFAAVLFSAVPVLADWPIGSQELGPAPGIRSMPSFAASRHGVLAVWYDYRSGNWDLLAAWLSAEGQPLETIRIARQLYSSLAVATDGESHLVTWREAGTLRSGTVDREGVVTAQDLGVRDFNPAALAWNGSFYLAASDSGAMVLLDRQGSIASGVLTVFQAIKFEEPTVASSGTRWLYGWGPRGRLAMVDAADFPPVGESKGFSVPITSGRRPSARAASFRDGHVVVETAAAGWTNELVVQVYDSSGQPSGEVQRYVRPDRSVGSVVHLAVRNQLLYIAYRTCPDEPSCTTLATEVVEVRFRPHLSERRRDSEDGPSRERALEVNVLGTVGGRELHALVSTDAGVLAFAMGEDVQIYGALVGSEASRTGGTLWSADRAGQRWPRIASGAGAHLVAWVEERGYRLPSQLLFTVLADDGRPVGNVGTVPETIPVDVVVDPLVASDGQNFLLAWQSLVYAESVHSWETKGIIVSRAGEILRPPFLIARFALRSIVWNGVAYAAAARAQNVVLVGSDGTVLEPNPANVEDFPVTQGGQYGATFLARDGDSLLVLGAEYFCDPFGITSCSVAYEAAVRRSDLTHQAPDSAADRAWNGRRLCCSLNVHPYVQPVIAAGGGHRLLVWYESLGWPRWIGHVAGDTDTYDFDSGGMFPPQPRAVWTGSGFLVTQGPNLLRHAPTGALLERRSLGDDVLASDVAMGRVPFVVLLRDIGVPRLFVRPLDH